MVTSDSIVTKPSGFLSAFIFIAAAFATGGHLLSVKHFVPFTSGVLSRRLTSSFILGWIRHISHTAHLFVLQRSGIKAAKLSLWASLFCLCCFLDDPIQPHDFKDSHMLHNVSVNAGPHVHGAIKWIISSNFVCCVERKGQTSLRC